MERVSKKHVAGNTGTGTESDDAGGESAVDLGIGITVDLGVERLEDLEMESTETVELTFDEASDIEEPEGGDNDGGRARENRRSVGATATDGARDERTHGNPTRPTTDARPIESRTITPTERESLEAADIDPAEIREKACSYRMLLDAEVEESTAATLRRRFSLPWSFESDGDLERRSSEVRGLGAAEREWIALSDDEEWQSFEYEHAVESAVGREQPSERPWPEPTPVTAVAGVGPDDADALATAGIHSASQLARASAFEVARVLDLQVLHVRTWRHNARELLE
ncbi:hypothetical protein BB347_02720 [Natronorubrum daqingense]|uniref:Helix-hairpin-helix domain-containing protein n=1 Tax=Natronorubrum daqingense TaxID=588898 RepID=A0A1P8RHT4_9EURY|nr:hypothetical protein BB347_02720 [Natronorubrum daqingense]